ncbi:hypothetical protein VKT23_008749 [Stygiomarasmius scandens]|uniref:Uncharacterized protein n=1 Tax=Marasmiellus scandens TaxID=2682957 RepID=A0ABR1JGJ6_9AGAR
MSQADNDDTESTLLEFLAPSTATATSLHPPAPRRGSMILYRFTEPDEFPPAASNSKPMSFTTRLSENRMSSAQEVVIDGLPLTTTNKLPSPTTENLLSFSSVSLPPPNQSATSDQEDSGLLPPVPPFHRESSYGSSGSGNSGKSASSSNGNTVASISASRRNSTISQLSGSPSHISVSLSDDDSKYPSFLRTLSSKSSFGGAGVAGIGTGYGNGAANGRSSGLSTMSAYNNVPTGASVPDSPSSLVLSSTSRHSESISHFADQRSDEKNSLFRPASTQVLRTHGRGLVPYIYDPDTDEAASVDDEDMLHDPAFDEEERPTFFFKRNSSGKRQFVVSRSQLEPILKIITLILLIFALLALFTAYPIIRAVRDGGIGRFREGDWVGDQKQIPLQSLPSFPSLIDADTPNTPDVRMRTGFDGEEYELVFSDEFEKEGRTFYPGDDPFWESPSLWYGATQDVEWYDPSQVTTRNGSLVVTLDSADVAERKTPGEYLEISEKANS